jgi:putative aminopeptidase FrvX
VPVPDLLRSLLTAAGPSGYEAAPSRVWRAVAADFADTSSDAMGSSVALVRGSSDGPRLAVLGHIDEIGLVVTHVDEDGFLYFRGIGGWRAEVLRGQRIEILTRAGPVPGVVARRYSKRPKPGESQKPTELEELHIDIGARGREEALGLVRIGDAAVVAAEPLELPNGRLVSRALDNRLGAYVALEAARIVSEAGGSPGDVVAIAAVQEEVGDFAGARTSTFAVEPAVALAVDVTHATDVPGGDPKEGGEARLGGGPAINRGSTISPRVFEMLVETAEAEGIDFSIEVSTGETHTDADAAYVSRAGVAAGLVSIPLRYMHTPTELVSLDDVERAARLVAAFAQRLGRDLDLTR